MLTTTSDKLSGKSPLRNFMSVSGSNQDRVGLRITFIPYRNTADTVTIFQAAGRAAYRDAISGSDGSATSMKNGIVR